MLNGVKLGRKQKPARTHPRVGQINNPLSNLQAKLLDSKKGNATGNAKKEIITLNVNHSLSKRSGGKSAPYRFLVGTTTGVGPAADGVGSAGAGATMGGMAVGTRKIG